MADDKHPIPLRYKGVMVSSTFTDLKDHRAAIIKAIEAQGLKAVVMENDAAKPGVDVIASSLQMVRDSSAYVAVISHKYGQVPECPERNPDQLSLTELEFNEAQRLDRPVLLFIMGDDHPVRPADVEIDPEKRRKLAAFRENAKRLKSDAAVHRVYKVFNNLHEFEVAANQSIAALGHYLDKQSEASASEASEQQQISLKSGSDRRDPIPAPPTFYAEPAYIGSHNFVGRKAQLETLSDWASAADAHPVLLFEAIGGAGKSMLTWEWTTKHSTSVRGDWAGRFWYSFYEKGAVMADFCRRALAYITGQPVESFYKKKTVELGEQLLHHLQARPWLLILDGLERVLVAYHRYDAAQLPDEQAGTTDEIVHRDPCSAIRPEDDDLLRALAGVAPSKILITSRLIPRILLNAASQPIPGVLRERLPGLRPADAEALLRSCGITGSSQEIQIYLQSHCDCHPLVTGVLAGLINDYLPSRGNFDAWVNDPAGGGQLNLAKLNLVQKHNHILHAALAALPEKSRQLLSILALLSESVDYDTLNAFNPHMPAEPEKVERPEKPEDSAFWKYMSYEDQELEQQLYRFALQRYNEYEEAMSAWRRSPEFLAAPQELAKTVSDLERRGLLQYNAQAKRYDLHPVVRGIAAGNLRQKEKESYGQRVVDYFSQQTHNPYETAETLDDLRHGRQIIRTLLQMHDYKKVLTTLQEDLAEALVFNLEAYSEFLSLIRPLFPLGWASLLSGLFSELDYGYLASWAAGSLLRGNQPDEALIVCGISLLSYLQDKDWRNVREGLSMSSTMLSSQNRLAKQECCLLFALDLANLIADNESIFLARFHRFSQLAETGQATEAEKMWQLLDPMGRSWHRAYYRPGEAEYTYALFCFRRGNLQEKRLAEVEQIAQIGRSRAVIRDLYRLRGEWQMAQDQWQPAADSFHEAVRMAREVGQSDATAETLLAIAKFHLDKLPDPKQEAERLAGAEELYHRGLAELWLLIGDAEQAKKQALAAYEWAWADGEPYVSRYELNKAHALLDQLGVEIPKLPPYDPAKDEKLPWEDEVLAAIEKLRAEVNAKKQAEEAAKARKKKKKKRPTSDHP